MKKIKSLVRNHQEAIQKIENQKLKKHEELKSKIKIAKNYLHQLRLYVRTISFEDIDEEFNFFKIIKPTVCGQLKCYRKQLDYLLEKPSISLELQKEYILKQLRKLELQKKKNAVFYRYIKQEETACDEIYFTRGGEQLELFSMCDFVDADPEFSTSHDLIVSQVITYDLLTEFYRKELHCISNMEAGYYETNNNVSKHNLSWTSSKTDLIELIYSLKISGAVNGGDANIKQLIETFENMFGIELGNYYKTYNEIRNRNKDQTKFLSKLTMNLLHKLELDEV